MSTEQDKKRDRLADEFFTILGRFSPTDRTDQSMALAARALELGADLPPEPEWKLGQEALLTIGVRTVLGIRTHAGWTLVGEIGGRVSFSDDEVTDVEPVAVLTAEDVRGVAARVAQRMVASGISDGLWTQLAGEAVEDEFRERGLDL